MQQQCTSSSSTPPLQLSGFTSWLHAGRFLPYGLDEGRVRCNRVRSGATSKGITPAGHEAFHTSGEDGQCSGDGEKELHDRACVCALRAKISPASPPQKTDPRFAFMLRHPSTPPDTEQKRSTCRFSTHHVRVSYLVVLFVLLIDHANAVKRCSSGGKPPHL